VKTLSVYFEGQKMGGKMRCGYSSDIRGEVPRRRLPLQRKEMRDCPSGKEREIRITAKGKRGLRGKSTSASVEGGGNSEKTKKKQQNMGLPLTKDLLSRTTEEK